MSNDRGPAGRRIERVVLLLVALCLAAPSVVRAAGRAHGVLLLPGFDDQGATKLDWIRDTMGPTEDWHVLVVNRTPDEKREFDAEAQKQPQWANKVHYVAPDDPPEPELRALNQRGIQHVIVVVDMNVDKESFALNGRSEHRWAARQSAKWERSLRAVYSGAAVGAVSHSFGNGGVSGGLLKNGLVLDYWLPVSPGSSRAKLNVPSRRVRNQRVLSLTAVGDFHKLATVDGHAEFDHLTIGRHPMASTGPHSIAFDAAVVDTSTNYSSSLNLSGSVPVRAAISDYVARATIPAPPTSPPAGRTTSRRATMPQPKPEVADYYTTAGPDVPTGKTRTEARVISGLAGAAKRAVVYGTDPAADVTERAMVAKLGLSNVRRVRQDPRDGREPQRWARAFDADVVLGVRQHATRASRDAALRSQRDRNDAHSPSFGGSGSTGPGTASGHTTSAAPPMAPPGVWHRSRVGGVLLEGAAEVAGGAGARYTNASFSLVFDRADAGVDVDELRRFVTALWAVYFGDEGPGISIDPIAPGVDKHLVRYIGHVMHSDLGRVMREADYLMKRWAVGTDRSDLPGFRNPDDIAGTRGRTSLLGSSRFWFVPEAMRFRKADGLLLFDDGRMTLRTEYLSGGRNVRTNAANDAWAAWVSEHYAELAVRHPVLGELFEYAKLVSFAKYLKQRGMPLFWYLMANKDLLLTEDSPGTVEALATRSRHFEHVEIQGGVDLAQAPRPAQYRIDGAAAAALREARELFHGSLATTGSTVRAPTPLALDACDGRCMLADPRHLSLGGNGFGGDTYQTDVTLRRGTGTPGLDLVRYYGPSESSVPTFGAGWHLLVPYEVSPASTARIAIDGVLVPRTMEVQNLLSGEREVLELSPDRYTIAGWVPTPEDDSTLIGLFPMSDGSSRLADKAGNEYRFDGLGRLTAMIFAENHTVHLEYGTYEVPARSFSTTPYRLEPMGTERVDVHDVTLPKRLRVVDESGEGGTVYVFAPDDLRGIVGYVPEDDAGAAGAILALRSDGSFRLDLGRGRQVDFDAAGGLDILRIPTIDAMTGARERITFAYEFARGAVRIREARVSTADGATHVVSYGYDAQGRLECVERPAGGAIRIRYGADSVHRVDAVRAGDAATAG